MNCFDVSNLKEAYQRIALSHDLMETVYKIYALLSSSGRLYGLKVTLDIVNS